MSHVHRCPICGDPYKVYNWKYGDQSACPDCRAEAEEKMRRKERREH